MTQTEIMDRPKRQRKRKPYSKPLPSKQRPHPDRKRGSSKQPLPKYRERGNVNEIDRTEDERLGSQVELHVARGEYMRAIELITTRALATRGELERLTLDSHLAELPLSPKLVTLLEQSGLHTLGDVFRCSRAQLLAISQMGPKSYEFLYGAMAAAGFALDGDQPE